MTNKFDELSLKIPGLLQGSLSAAEEKELNDFAAQNPDFADEIEFQRAISTTLKRDVSDFTPGDMGWARLSRAMNKEAIQPVSVSNHQVSTNGFWKYAASIFAITLIGQSIFLINTLRAQDDERARYALVSEAAQTTEKVSIIGFSQQASHGDVSELIASNRGTIIDGPNSLGLYKVSFKTKLDCDTAIDIFMTEPGLIDTATICE